MRDEGKAGKESFFIVLKDVLDDIFIPETQEITDNSDETDYVGDDIIPETQDLPTCEENCDAEFINEVFYKTLINKIKEEVSIAVKQLNLSNVQNIVNDLNVVDKTKECDISKDDKLYNTLISEITFLRNELSSKDAIIKMLINDRNCEKHASKSIDNAPNKSETISNRYESDVSVKKCTDKELKDIEKRNEGEFTVVNHKKKKTNKRTITILGDSIVKEVNPWLMQKKVDHNTKIYKHSFNGAKTDQMYHHANAIMPFEPDLVILHVGTNNLRDSTSAENIAGEIINLATKLRTDKNEIIISGITERRDSLRDKVKQVNHFLNNKCHQLNLPFILHDNIKSDTHLKPKGVHLNKAGSSLLASNFINWVNK